MEFMDCISDLLELEGVQKLSEYFQHCSTTRLQHSINVAYHSYRICKFLHFDYKSAARAGLLHDLFYYDWTTEKTPERHTFYHPKEALKNALEMTDINAIEADAIVMHMWPRCFGIPRYKESYVITVTDKYCAVMEVCQQLKFRIKSHFN